MDTLRNYKEFTKDIFDGFKSLITEFQLRMITPYDGCYVLHNDKCGIKFTYDRGDVFCAFLKRSGSLYDHGYNVPSVFGYLYPNKSIDDGTGREYDRRKQIFQAAELINDYLKNVLEGDFTWLDGFIRNRNEENKLFAFALHHFPSDHYISKKLWGGDESWKDDVKMYLTRNKINI